MKEKFIERDFKRKSLKIISQANEMLTGYQRQGYTVTLRQLYYQFVQAGLLENEQRNYKMLGAVLNDARLAGLIDWSAMEDRTRNVQRHSAWGDSSHMIRSAAQWYAEDLWASQKVRVEYWVEKESLINVVQIAGDKFQIPYFACRGYLSQSEAYAAGKRFERYRREGHKPIVIHLGDHDPSGVDMTRDNADRLRMFARMGVEVKRIALNMDQIEEHTLPPNPAKDTDSRHGGYAEVMVEEHGYPEDDIPSWELDALSPDQINDLLEEATFPLIDPEARAKDFEKQENERQKLRVVENNWPLVQRYLQKHLGTEGFVLPDDAVDQVAEDLENREE